MNIGYFGSSYVPHNGAHNGLIYLYGNQFKNMGLASVCVCVCVSALGVGVEWDFKVRVKSEAWTPIQLPHKHTPISNVPHPQNIHTSQTKIP